jgi:N-acetylmuramoyl-L-alanine amidase CwlA/uncharacterized protein YjdB
MVFFAGSNSIDDPIDENPIEEEQTIIPIIEVNPNAIHLKIGDSFQIFPVVLHAKTEEDLLYSSTSDAIAFVDEDGTIHAMKEGKCDVTIILASNHEIKASVSVNVEKEVDEVFPLTFSGPTSIFVGDVIQMQATDSNHPENIVYWESSDTSILQVDAQGNIKGVNEGVVQVKISSYYTNHFLEKEITVHLVVPTAIEIKPLDNLIYAPNSSVKLGAQVLPIQAKQDIVWKSNDEETASVNEFGNVYFHKSGEVTIEAQVVGYELSAFISLKVEISPISVFDVLHVINPIVQKDVMHWAYSDPLQNKTSHVYGSVSRYLFTNLNINDTSYWLSPTAANFDSRTFEQPEYIVIHDTWNPTGAGAANAALVTSLSNTKTCWHFTVGNDGIFQSLSEFQYGKHAGDGGADFALIETNILATSENKPTLSISQDGYWMINDIKSNILVPLLNGKIPLMSQVTDSGVLVEINDLGHYVIGTTYYNATYNVIANTGGNARGIGIETAMNFGSDLYLTWQHTAKLTADLMFRHHLDINRVRQHNFFSGKDCPRTMRKAFLWEEFLSLVEGEYLAVTNLKGYTISFISHNPDLVNNIGRIIQLPLVDTKVSYTVQIENEKGLVGEKTYYSFLPAK